MKFLVFLLLLANLLVAAYGGGYFGRPDNPDAGRVDKQIMPERMRIVSRGEAPEAAAKAASQPAPAPRPEAPPQPEAEASPPPAPPGEAASPVAAPSAPADNGAEAGTAEAKVAEAVAPATEATCLIWRQLPLADADRLAALLAKRFADYKVSQQKVISESNGWWVVIPPLPGKAEADKKAGELLGLGVKEYFVIQDGASRFGISLGVFSNEKGARDRLAELRTQGVRSAVAAPRPGKDDSATLQARGPAKRRSEVLAAAGRLLPAGQPQACK